MMLHEVLRLLVLTLPLLAYFFQGSVRRVAADQDSLSASSFRRRGSGQGRQRRGLVNRRSSPRIVGGKDVTPATNYPFFANWYEQGCGATLIAPDMLLSAAHCYIEGPFGRMVLGSVQYEGGGKSYDIEEVWYHPSFDGDFYSAPQYDFLIARVNESIPESVATTVTLNTNPNVPNSTNEELMVIGFGSLGEDGNEYPSILQEVTVPYLQTEPVCQRLWNGAIQWYEMCTVDPSGIKDSCYGDSGGPLLSLPDLHQVGIVSWGDGCARPESPAVAARVSAVAESWIQPQVCLHSRADTLPSYCQETTVDLPLSLRLDLMTNVNGPRWQSQNISFGLYRVTPPEVMYLVKDGVTILNNLPPPTVTERTATTRKKEKDKDKKKKKDREEVAEDEAIYTFQFENLKAGLYYFRISQEPEDLQQVGTFQHVRLTQGGKNDDSIEDNNNFHRDFVGVNGNRASLPTVVEHSWMELDGSTFQGFSNQYVDLHSTWMISDVELPGKGYGAADGPHIELTIDAFYDSAPQETSWELRDLTTDQVLLTVNTGEIAQPGFATYNVQVPATTSHILQFRIWDSGNDGICCGPKGNGWIEIWAGLGRVWAFDGRFDDEFEFQFQL